MVVRRDGEGLDAGVDEELGQDALDLSLAALEVVAGDKGALLLGEANRTGDKRVLRGAVDEGRVLEDGGDGKECRGRDLVVRRGDRGEEGLGRVVDAGQDRRVTLSVGRPEDDDRLEAVGSLGREHR